MKAYSQANRGKPFEDFLKFVHQRYQQSGTACVHKVPTEFIPIRNARGEVCNCKVEGKLASITSEDTAAPPWRSKPSMKKARGSHSTA